MLSKIQSKLNIIWKKSTALDVGERQPILFQYNIFNEVSCCTRMLNFKSGECALEIDRWSLAIYPKEANILIVCGHVSKKAETVIRSLRAQLLPPQGVIFLGSCGAHKKLHIFSEENAGETMLYVPGCPVNPEDVHTAILKFVEKIHAK